MADFLLTSGVIFVVLTGWLYVQELYRRFARRNPGLGPFRGEGGGCGGGCSCSQGSQGACSSRTRVAERKLQITVAHAPIMISKESQQ